MSLLRSEVALAPPRLSRLTPPPPPPQKKKKRKAGLSSARPLCGGSVRRTVWAATWQRLRSGGATRGGRAGSGGASPPFLATRDQFSVSFYVSVCLLPPFLSLALASPPPLLPPSPPRNTPPNAPFRPGDVLPLRRRPSPLLPSPLPSPHRWVAGTRLRLHAPPLLLEALHGGDPLPPLRRLRRRVGLLLRRRRGPPRARPLHDGGAAHAAVGRGAAPHPLVRRLR